MLDPKHSLHVILRRLCSLMLDLQQSLHVLLSYFMKKTEHRAI